MRTPHMVRHNINAIAIIKIQAAKLKGTSTSAGINNIADIAHLLINLGLSGANIAPNIAATIIDALNQQRTPTPTNIWNNIPKYILKH